MQDQNLHEIWQVEVNGSVYEAPFFELGDWIGGGSLQPEDKVRKGNLRWIEARRVPSLVPFFNAKAKGEPMPVLITTTVAEPIMDAPQPAAETIGEPQLAAASSAAESFPMPAVPNPDICVLHADVESFFICNACGNGLCRQCPRSYGGTVKICPMCGALCRQRSEVAVEKKRSASRSSALASGFGIADFFTALGHPLRFKGSLFIGAVMFAAFSVGQSVSALGGIFMVASALICLMLANMLTFGVLSHTVENFVQGELDENFMPGFEDFSIWDDVLHPFFLSIAAYLASFGPFIVVAAVGLFMVLNAVSSQVAAVNSRLEKIPGTEVYAGRKLADQSSDVKEILNGIDQRQAERIATATELGDSDAAQGEPANANVPFIDQESRDQEELWAMAQESRKVQLESVIGKTPETEAREQAEMIKSFLSLAAPFVIFGALTFLWGMLLYPAACAVAGYTRSFVATINPLTSLDTMRRLGVNYVKILLMCVCLLFMAGFVSGVLSLILSPFALPGLGNVPAKFFGGMFGFYMFAVFSCILGYALFKSQDRLLLRS